MTPLEQVQRRMREDWDARAREDASYFVAFGRRRQTPDEFFASAKDVLRKIEEELERFGPQVQPRDLTALEIGCGPGRLMVPLSRMFGRIAGVDVSEEMVALARRNLAGADHASVSVANGADLAGFEDESIDLVYSYAVFQHIPSRDVVLSYLCEACRVLRPGGILKCQVNSLPRSSQRRLDPVPGWSLRSGARPRTAVQQEPPDTWSGVSFQGEEIAAFTREHGLQLLAMDGFETQYLWFTARKPAAAAAADESPPARIRIASNTFTSDCLTPQAGRFASASLRVTDLPERADLNNLRIDLEGLLAAPAFINQKTRSGEGQVNFFLPPGVRSGAVAVRLLLENQPISNLHPMQVIPAAPLIPRLLSVTDGVNLLSDLATSSRTLKAHIEEAPCDTEEEVRSLFTARLDDAPIEIADVFCVDPLARRYEINLTVPEALPAGPYNLYCRLGQRAFPHIGLRIAG